MKDKILLNVDYTIYKTNTFKRISPGVKYAVNQPDKIIVPIPGTIHKINVQTGFKVKKGDILYILEAMKSYNKMIADFSGLITDILIKTGEKVKKGQIIMLMEQKEMVEK